MAAWLKNYNDAPKRSSKSFGNMSIRLETLLALDGQTDRSGEKYHTLHALHAEVH